MGLGSDFVLRFGFEFKTGVQLFDRCLHCRSHCRILRDRMLPVGISPLISFTSESLLFEHRLFAPDFLSKMAALNLPYY